MSHGDEQIVQGSAKSVVNAFSATANLQARQKDKGQLPNLDALRFLAFFGVFVFHFNARLFFAEGKHALPYLDLLFKQGYMGVNFFFVLSGFLITYLLLKEEQKGGSFHVLYFWLRRVLRIWPLYLATVFYGFVVFRFLNWGNPSYQETAQIGWYLAFLPNFNLIANGYPLCTSLTVLWSVGIEEQFYLFWPVLLLIRRFRAFLFPIMILSSLVFRYYWQDDHFVLLYHSFSFIGDLAIGGFLAYIIVKYGGNRSVIYLNPYLVGVVYLIGITFVFAGDIFFNRLPQLLFTKNLILALFFGFVVFEQVYNSRPVFQASKLPFFHRLGKYTYGLYCIHPLGIMVGYYCSKALGLVSNISWIISGEFFISLCVTLLIAVGSFHYFEKPFLQWKSRFYTRV